MLKNFIRRYLEKPVRYIAGIILIGLFIGLVSAALNKAQAEEHPMVEGYPPGMIEPVMLPLYCGNSKDVLTHTTLRMDMKFIMSGEVRRGGNPDNELLGTMSFWYNQEKTQGVFYITLGQEQNFTCLLSYGVEMKFDIDTMLDIINEEMK